MVLELTEHEWSCGKKWFLKTLPSTFQLLAVCHFPKCLKSGVGLDEALHEPVRTLHRFLSAWRRVWCVVSSAALHKTQKQCVVTARVITCPVSFIPPACSVALSCIRDWHSEITASLVPRLRRSLHTLIGTSFEHREKWTIHAHFGKQ